MRRLIHLAIAALAALPLYGQTVDENPTFLEQFRSHHPSQWDESPSKPPAESDPETALQERLQVLEGLTAEDTGEAVQDGDLLMSPGVLSAPSTYTLPPSSPQPRAPPVEVPSLWIARQETLIKGLDKVTARVFSATIPVNQKTLFGTLEVQVRAVFERPPEEIPEKACFLEIYDAPPGKPRRLVFSGWMFASNPALSALEHPVYDIWIEQD